MQSASIDEGTRPVATRRRFRRTTRYLGTALIVGGVLMLAWAFSVWRWEDPITGIYAAWEQRQLDAELSTLIRESPPPPAPKAQEPPSVGVARLRREARDFRRGASDGEAIGRLRVPRLGLTIVMVEGTDAASLRKGPGRDDRTFMPGEGKLVYVAGHRTTYSAPFARIDSLRPGDRVTLEMPYGTFDYVVARSRIVDDEDLAVLESGKGEEVALQACHPRFFASQRYIVWAKPVRPLAIDGRTYARADHA
jgi:sortase A